MICKNCSADIGNNGKCEYCDTVYFEDFQQQKDGSDKRKASKEKNSPKSIPGKIWAKINPSTKMASAMWVLCCMTSLPNIASIGHIRYLQVTVVGAALFGGITQLISACYNKRHKPTQGETKKTKLNLSTKIVLAIWLLCSIIALSGAKDPLTFYQHTCISLFGFLFYGGITQLISNRAKRRHKPGQSGQSTQDLSRNADSPQKPYDHMDSYEFEIFCCGLLKKNGFTGISVTKTPENQGVDIIAFKNGARYGIQCKYGSSNLGITAVQKASAGKAFFECDFAAVLTNQYFVSNAKELADREDILLWDRDKLDKFME